MYKHHEESIQNLINYFSGKREKKNKILFSCYRRIEEFIEKAHSKPEGIIELGREFLEKFDDESLEKFAKATTNWTFDINIFSESLALIL
ncbi:MAG: hypothetical protein K0S61_2796 [Anaerocolumna sp.]|jgi:hypothetical protein|nr:hypothetical protein [Anaerocolumna sp.]